MKLSLLYLIVLLLLVLVGCGSKQDALPESSPLSSTKIAAPADAPPTKPKTYLTVNALSGLNYRDVPKGKVLGNFPYYSRLELVGKSGVFQEIRDEGKRIKGEWVAVLNDQDQDTVYVFDGFLLPDQKPDSEEKLKYAGVYAMRTYLDKGFISLTDDFGYNNHPDSLSIDPQYLGNNDSEEYHVMKKKYRDRFLQRQKIKETDTVYVYQFSKDRLFKYPVHQLSLLAHITIYGSSKPVPQYDYLIGFWFEKENYSEEVLYGNTFVSIGNGNPFVRRGLVPIVWKKTHSTLFPKVELNERNEKLLKNKIESETYTFRHENMTYFLKDYGRGIRQLLVKSQMDSVLYSNVLVGSEGTSLAPFSFKGQKSEDDHFQWTGRLLKDEGPVMFGFFFVSFGCPWINVLDGKNGYRSIACDNRH